jgi:RHS repeat-associated protein
VYSYTNRFVYDGWNVVAILDGANKLLYSFMWGTDLSGSMQGAGGVGGAISMTVYGTNAGTYFYCYDANGNVVALVNAANGTVAAQYEYGPFGELIRATGPMAKVNPFLFQTEFYDWETGKYYVKYRYYDPGTGRWLSKDQLAEYAFIATHRRLRSLQPEPNLYAFVGNSPVGKIDGLGLATVTFPTPGGNCSCCTSTKIAAGQATLTQRFGLAVAYLDSPPPPKTPLQGNANSDPPPGNGTASCYASNDRILNFMQSTPPCWVCFMDNAQGHNGIQNGYNHYDENFIHCIATDGTQIAYDWFQHWETGTSGIYAYSYFVNILHTGGQGPIGPAAGSRDCNNDYGTLHGGTWTPDYSIFNDLW